MSSTSPIVGVVGATVLQCAAADTSRDGTPCWSHCSQCLTAYAALRHADTAERQRSYFIGRVLVVEIVVSPGQPMGHPHPMIDLEMMVTFGGKERTEQEFATLLSSAGSTLEQVTPINGSFFSVVEATPA